MSLKSFVRTMSMLMTIVLLFPAVSDSDLRAAPQFTCCPEIVRVQVGKTLTFTLDVSDTAIAADYRWSLTLLSPNVPSFSVTVDSLTGLVSITNPNLSVSPNFDYRLVVSDSSGSSDSCYFPLQISSWMMGDANNTGSCNVSDATYLLHTVWQSWPPPTPMGDANCSGEVNVSDIVYIINFIFHHGPAPCTPCPW